MKKYLLTATSLLTALIMLCFTSCTTEHRDHEHIHVEVLDSQEIAPTCTEPGFTAGYRCKSCNEITLEPTKIEALGHTEVIDYGTPPTSFEGGMSDGLHCSVCNTVLKEQQPLGVVAPVKIDFPGYGTVTTKETVIKTDHFKFRIPANVYIPKDFVKTVNLISSVMEKVSGLKFKGNANYSPDLLVVDVEKTTDSQSEYGDAYAYHGGLVISSGDLINLYALIHEASHALHLNQSPWNYCKWAMEGISTYTTYKTAQYIEINHPELVPSVCTVNQSFINYYISNYNELYKHDLEYWIKNTFEHNGNNNYSIGFRFMWYLDKEYGNYTDWITEYEKINPYHKQTDRNELTVSEQTAAFKTTYGDNVFDEFYPWLKKHEADFELQVIDLQHAEKIQIYPFFSTFTEYRFDTLTGIKYKDLYIDLSVGNKYAKDYKKKSTNNLELLVAGDATIELYDSRGRLCKVERINELQTAPENPQRLSLKGISFVKLAGEGKFTHFNIIGIN